MRTVLSPNYSPGWPYGKPQAVMIHSTRSGQNWSHAQELGSALNTFSSRASEVSAHCVVSPDEAVRVVADENRAWTAGQHNGYAYQIELTQALTTTPYEEGHYRNLVVVVQPYIMAGVPVLYEPFYVNGRKGFTGHEDSTHGKQNGKSDPGDLFDWPKFIGMLRGETEEEEDDDMAKLILLKAPNDTAVYVTDWITKNHVTPQTHWLLGYFHVPKLTVAQAILDDIPDA